MLRLLCSIYGGSYSGNRTSNHFQKKYNRPVCFTFVLSDRPSVASSGRQSVDVCIGGQLNSYFLSALACVIKPCRYTFSVVSTAFLGQSCFNKTMHTLQFFLFLSYCFLLSKKDTHLFFVQDQFGHNNESLEFWPKIITFKNNSSLNLHPHPKLEMCKL